MIWFKIINTFCFSYIYIKESTRPFHCSMVLALTFLITFCLWRIYVGKTATESWKIILEKVWSMMNWIVLPSHYSWMGDSNAIYDDRDMMNETKP